MNNFHGFFPGGYIREEANQNPMVKKIISEVDRLIAETNFDFNKYQGLVKAVRKQSDLLSETFQLNSLEKRLTFMKANEHLLNEGEKAREEINRMLSPYFEKLSSAGYDEKELRH